ncbi:PDDEXK nuclease domain-containing protein [uncultured Lamprocystis sp.]|jgi:predicted nuclease of restriction endonuclease-like (RecB) superfamily|uniref:PDDEXK nuclease domain-containing protein n=3 Tax=uncultured Lamprocystis sp. TaxID=543132 RepID=UPI0025D49286|nr:PDDEXK nuclease domain-containing protein [uncultured Lamprocystis sp.]
MSKPNDYTELLAEIKARIQTAQTRAVLAANSELIRLYWQIGEQLTARQAREGWGAGVIPRLARDLHNELPELKGFSERNLKLMAQFFRAYPALFADHAPIGQPAVAQLPWAHNVLLMQTVKDERVRNWYVGQAVAEGWSRNVLKLQIASQAHRRQGNAVTNFAARLPAPQSDLVQQALKDPYIFDFLTLQAGFQERELETSLVRHLEKFLIELGRGFAFVGRQYHVTVGESDFYIDLLFYHLKLRCYLVIDLKRGDFKPEYAGKLNFYCNVVDDTLRHATDAPTIGLILCQGKDRVLAEYALRGIDKPLGIASYELMRALPQSLQSALPSIESLEAELADALNGSEPSADKDSE